MNIPGPDQRWLPFLKMGFGFLVLFMLAALAGLIALGKVEAKSSFGLEGILGALGVLAGGFSQWAFTPGRDINEDKDGK